MQGSRRATGENGEEGKRGIGEPETRGAGDKETRGPAECGMAEDPRVKKHLEASEGYPSTQRGSRVNPDPKKVATV